MRALVKLEQVLPVAPAPPRQRAADRRPRRSPPSGPDGRPRGADGDRRRLPRPRAPALRLPRPRRRPRAAARVEPHSARQPRPPLVPRRLGLRPRGLAHLPRRPPRRARRPAGARFAAARRCPATTPAAYVAANLSGAPSRYQARVTLHAPAAEMRRALALRRGTRRGRSTSDTCECARATTRSTGWRCASAMLGVEFEVHEPPELVERVRELAARFERAAGTAAVAGGRRRSRFERRERGSERAVSAARPHGVPAAVAGRGSCAPDIGLRRPQAPC